MNLLCKSGRADEKENPTCCGLYLLPLIKSRVYSGNVSGSPQWRPAFRGSRFWNCPRRGPRKSNHVKSAFAHQKGSLRGVSPASDRHSCPVEVVSGFQATRGSRAERVQPEGLGLLVALFKGRWLSRSGRDYLSSEVLSNELSIIQIDVKEGVREGPDTKCGCAKQKVISTNAASSGCWISRRLSQDFCSVFQSSAHPSSAPSPLPSIAAVHVVSLQSWFGLYQPPHFWALLPLLASSRSPPCL